MRMALDAFRPCAQKAEVGRGHPDCPFEHVTVIFGAESPNRDANLRSVAPKVRALLERQYPQLKTAQLSDGSHVKFAEWQRTRRTTVRRFRGCGGTRSASSERSRSCARDSRTARREWTRSRTRRRVSAVRLRGSPAPSRGWSSLICVRRSIELERDYTRDVQRQAAEFARSFRPRTTRSR